MRARDVLSRQGFVAGRITDAITASAPRAMPRVRLVRASDGVDLPDVIATVRSDAWFVVHGDPRRLPPAQPITLRVEISAEGYAIAIRDLALSAVDLARTAQTVSIAGADSLVEIIAAAPFAADTVIWPLPIALAGRVSRAESPAEPIIGASITVTAPVATAPVLSDGEGRFRIAALPVAETIDLAITAPGRAPFNGSFRADYRTPINQRSFTLEPM